jgi:hypothetical protein
MSQPTLTDLAASIGAEHGKSAASWVFDGNTDTDSYRRVLAGIEDGDPLVMDAYRIPDLSGEFADDYTLSDLMRDLGLPLRHTLESDLDDYATAWEDAASEAFWHEVERTARDYLTSIRVTRLWSAGFEITYVNREDAEDGSLPPYRHYRQDRPEDGREAYVDLGSVASGEDAYGQVDTVRRSNFRRLQEDYPDMWTLVSYTNTDALGAFVNDLDDDVTEVLVNLATQYPVYDDDDMSQLENDETSERWDDYAADDFRGELPEDAQEAWDELGDEEQRELFWSACEAAGYYPEHSGVEVLWSYVFDKTAGIVAGKLS